MRREKAGSSLPSPAGDDGAASGSERKDPGLDEGKDDAAAEELLSLCPVRVAPRLRTAIVVPSNS